jgi:uncharacterized phage-like protein YoqJ
MRFRFGWDEEDSLCIRLKLVLLQQIQELRRNGITQFMTACDPGVGLWGGELINTLRDGDDDLQLYCVLPHEEQARKWPPYLRKRYFELLEKCTFISAISLQKTSTAQLDAYKYMIGQCEILLAVYDPNSARGDEVDEAMAYAIERQRQLIVIHPDTLQITAGHLRQQR